MKRLEQQASVDQLGQTGGETAIDTQIEVDLICGGVGFDDGPTDDGQWLKEARNKQKSKVNNKELPVYFKE